MAAALALILAIVGGVVGLIVILYLVYLCRWLRKQLALSAKALEAKQDKIKDAHTSLTDCSYPMSLIKFSDFTQYSYIPKHEEARANGHLCMLDTYQMIKKFTGEKTVVFISHQWLGFKKPDENNHHYKAMVSALEEILKLRELNPGELYLWVDYTSIPQDNHHLQKLSIQSLAIYASSVSAFVIIAPPVDHTDSGKPCNTSTYQGRGWCRLEQWAKIASGNIDGIYLYDGSTSSQLSVLQPIKADENWFRDSVNVYGGNFTEESDKSKLIDTVLGLWSATIEMSKKVRITDEGIITPSISTDFVMRMGSEHRDVVFPKKYFGDMIEILEAMWSSGELKSVSKSQISKSKSNLSPSPSKSTRSLRSASKYKASSVSPAPSFSCAQGMRGGQGVRRGEGAHLTPRMYP